MVHKKRTPVSKEQPRSKEPLVSCLMVSRGNLFPAELAITCYQRQTYPRRELVIVSAQPDNAVSRYVADLGDPSIRYVQSAPASLGELRNQSVSAARGALLCTWDDDDLHHDRRLEVQVRGCLRANASAHFLSRVLIWWPERGLLGITAQRPWENTMLARREALPLYPSVPFREDSHVVDQIKRQHKITTVDEPELFCYVVNSNNTCDTSHFERMFEQADWIYPDYDECLARLSAKFPIRTYADGLIAINQSADRQMSRLDGRPPLIFCSEAAFGQKNIQVDGIHFKNCSFEGTSFLYSGGPSPVFENCRFARIKINFAGSAANTFNWLRELKSLGLVP